MWKKLKGGREGICIFFRCRPSQLGRFPIEIKSKIRYLFTCRYLVKDSFLRALREVAPEMELFLENHGQYVKKFVIKLIFIESCTFRHFTKNMYLEEYV